MFGLLRLYAFYNTKCHFCSNHKVIHCFIYLKVIAENCKQREACRFCLTQSIGTNTFRLRNFTDLSSGGLLVPFKWPVKPCFAYIKDRQDCVAHDMFPYGLLC